MDRVLPRLSFCVLSLAGLLLAGGNAPAETVGSISVENAWSRAVRSGSKVAVGYLTVRNDGDEPDRLLGASAPFAGETEIHQTSMADGVMRMRPVPGGVSVPAKGTVKLEPNSYHLMFRQLTRPLEEGDTVSARLTFERSGSVDVAFKVLGMGAQDPKTELRQ